MFHSKLSFLSFICTHSYHIRIINSKIRMIINILHSLLTSRYHNNRMINHELDRGQQVQTKLANYSTFHLPTVTRKDSGNYTCAPHNLRPASVFIHIIDEDSNSAAAAIHTGGDEDNSVIVANGGVRASSLPNSHGAIIFLLIFTIMKDTKVHFYT